MMCCAHDAPFLAFRITGVSGHRSVHGLCRQAGEQREHYQGLHHAHERQTRPTDGDCLLVMVGTIENFGKTK